MNIANTKIELTKLILDINNPDLIEKIHKLVIREESDFWKELSDEEKREIKLGISQLNKGQKISFEGYIKKVS